MRKSPKKPAKRVYRAFTGFSDDFSSYAGSGGRTRTPFRGTGFKVPRVCQFRHAGLHIIGILCINRSFIVFGGGLLTAASYAFSDIRGPSGTRTQDRPVMSREL